MVKIWRNHADSRDIQGKTEAEIFISSNFNRNNFGTCASSYSYGIIIKIEFYLREIHDNLLS